MKIWAEMASPSIEETVKKTKIAILPIGSTEQHGPHLPTGTDHIIGWEIAKAVTEKLDAIILPVIPFGFSEDHMPKAGTVSLSADTLRKVIRDVAISLSISKVKHIILMTGHAGHIYQLADICFELNVTNVLGDTTIHNISPYTSVSIEMLAEILEEEMFLHAEELETSLMLLFREDLVDMAKAVKEYPSYIPRGLNTLNFLEALRIVLTDRFLGRDTETGVCGDATLATREKGEKIMAMMVDAVVAAIERAIR
jgi:creatinine amidohydrolase